MSTRSISLQRKQYPFVIRWTAIFTIVVISLGFLAFPKFMETINTLKIEILKEKEIVIIPPTKHNPPIPVAPIIPTLIKAVEEPEIIFDFPKNSIKDLKLPPVFVNRSTQDGFSKIYEFEPVAKTKIKPVYPTFALEMGIEDKVFILVFIDRDGIVQKAELINNNDPYGFGAAAIEAVIKTDFEPALMGRERVAVQVSMPFTYKIR
ncbi:MAG: energy transducer TonB [Candidatus Marinimicrobia bacterium]|nr:energy transducer TonB [Candidatus Neomarinimicrobiota bacterium]